MNTSVDLSVAMLIKIELLIEEDIVNFKHDKQCVHLVFRFEAECITCFVRFAKL